MPITIRRNVEQEASTNADQVEFDAYKTGMVNIDSGIDDELMADALDDYYETGHDPYDENRDVPAWMDRDVANDTAAGDIIQEIDRRASLLGEAYPFVRDRNSLMLRENYELYTYLFCLFVSVKAGSFVAQSRVFERLSSELSKVHIGPFGNTMHTGWPREAGAPANFEEFYRIVSERTGEWNWGPDTGLDEQEKNVIKDAGIDFISWLESPDKSRGKLFICGQCACGNDWNTKFHDAEPSKYRHWFNPPYLVAPAVKAFCTPFLLCRSNIENASRHAGLVYERTRLVLLAKDNEHNLSPELRSSLRDCITGAT